MELNWNTIVAYAEQGAPTPPNRVTRTEAEWQELLSPEQYRVARQSGTERPFSSEMCSLFEPGVYACIGCQTPLFDATQKFDSGTGWPSFTTPVKDNVVAYHKDVSHGMTRIEALCSVCDSHLGHVFPDGPAESTGLRYCINAVSLAKVK